MLPPITPERSLRNPLLPRFLCFALFSGSPRRPYGHIMNIYFDPQSLKSEAVRITIHLRRLAGEKERRRNESHSKRHSLVRLARRSETGVWEMLEIETKTATSDPTDLRSRHRHLLRH